MKNKVVIVAFIVCVLVGVLSFAAVPSQERTVTQGVYTNEQADRGMQVIEEFGCRNCHGGQFEGGPEEEPPLVGEQWVTAWAGKKLDELAEKITTMPANREAAYHVKPAMAPDVVALILRANGYPAGNAELPADLETLRRITIVAP